MSTTGPSERTALVARLRRAGCVYAEDEAALLIEAAGGDPGLLGRLAARRVSGEPLEQVVGWAALGGVRVRVSPGVFVPRRRTELLVREAVGLARAAGPRPVLVDLCCGSGAVAMAVAHALSGDVELVAADVDPAAVRCARGNLGTDATVLKGDLFDPLPPGLRGRVDVLTANVPYVPTADLALLPAEARQHEPRAALHGGADGLRVLARVADSAPGWLAPGGSLLSETSRGQADAAVALLAAAGLAPRLVVDDELGATVVVGTVGPDGTTLSDGPA